MLLIIIKLLASIACIYGCYKLAERLFDNHQKFLRILFTFIFIIIFFTLANGILKLVKPNVNVEKQLQSEEMYVALKSKYPEDYQAIVDKVTLKIRLNNLGKEEVSPLAQELLAPLALKFAMDASDDSRYEFAKSYAKFIGLLKAQGSTLCYDMMFDQEAVTANQTDMIDDMFVKSGMSQVILKIINDNKVGKAVASQRDMDAMEVKIFKQLLSRHRDDVQLLANPRRARSIEDKQTVCQLMIDFYELMNDPNDRVKKAVLRRNMENMVGGTSSIARDISRQIASPASVAEPELAAPAY